MPDKVKPLKIENSVDGTQDDIHYTETNPSEDYLAAAGISFQNSNGHLIDRYPVGDPKEGQLRFTDPVTGAVSLKDLFDLNQAQHRVSDQLVHLVAESSYEETSYTGNRVSSIVIWTNSSKTQKIREWVYTYSGNKVATEVVNQYNSSGILSEALTYTYTYSGNLLQNVSAVLT